MFHCQATPNHQSIHRTILRCLIAQPCMEWLHGSSGSSQHEHINASLGNLERPCLKIHFKKGLGILSVVQLSRQSPLLKGKTLKMHHFSPSIFQWALPGRRCTSHSQHTLPEGVRMPAPYQQGRGLRLAAKAHTSEIRRVPRKGLAAGFCHQGLQKSQGCPEQAQPG